MTKRLTWEEHVEAVQGGRTGFPVVEIVWEDALASATDWAEDAGNELMPTTTVGYLVSETRRSLTIVSLINTNHVGHGITIPKRCIVKRRTLV
jgi:hypothetical protein